MAKLTGDIITAGMHVWGVGFAGYNKPRKPVEMIIVTGKVSDLSKLQIAYVKDKDSETGIASMSYNDDLYGNYYLFLGDRGVRPFNYDSRPTQIFTTKEECETAIIEWAGENPNFLEGE